MPLDPELIPVLQGYEELGLPDLAHAEPEDFRSTMTAVPLEQPTTVAGVANRTIPGGDGQDLALRIYTPETDTCASLTLFFHGGGWVIGDLEIHDEFCRRLCIGSGSIIVAVDYSLAPEHKYPSGLEDCYAGQPGRLGTPPAWALKGVELSSPAIAPAVILLRRYVCWLVIGQVLKSAISC